MSGAASLLLAPPSRAADRTARLITPRDPPASKRATMPSTDNAQRSLRSLVSIAFATLALAGPGRALAQSAPPAEAPRPAGATEAPRPAGATEAPRPAGAAEAPRAGSLADVSQTSATTPIVVDVRATEGILEARGNPTWGASRDDDDNDVWRAVCAMPCRRTLDPRLEYRIAGAGISKTKPFRLPVGQPSLRLDVETGSRGSRVLGIVFIPVGATVLGVSLLGSLVTSALDDNGASQGFLIAAGAGALVMTGGIMLVRNNRSTVHASIPGEPSLRLASGLALTPRGLVF
jgi:hypothetical protein